MLHFSLSPIIELVRPYSESLRVIGVGSVAGWFATVAAVAAFAVADGGAVLEIGRGLHREWHRRRRPGAADSHCWRHSQTTLWSSRSTNQPGSRRHTSGVLGHLRTWKQVPLRPASR